MIKSDRMMLDSFPPSGRRAIAVIWKVCPFLYDLPFISASYCPSISNQDVFKTNPDRFVFHSFTGCEV